MIKLHALWKFSRPHTIIGTTLSVVGLYVIAYAHNAPIEGLSVALLLALLSCLGANIYIVGLNQLSDVEIDRVNKPDLPLPSGQFSITEARLIIGIALLLSLLLALSQGRYLTVTVVISVLIGTAYSLPPLRLKRYHFWAAASIFTVRGLVVNIFLFLHFNYLFSGVVEIPLHVWILTGFIFGLSLVIAWFKDIPDVEGDHRFRIMTLTIRLGANTVFRLGLAVLTLLFAGLIGVAVLELPEVNGYLLGGLNGGFLLLLWRYALRTDPSHKPAMTRFYLFIWGLFFSEYIAFALSCMLA